MLFNLKSPFFILGISYSISEKVDVMFIECLSRLGLWLVRSHI